MPKSTSQPIALLAAACLLIVAPQAAALSPTAAVSAAASVPTIADAKPRRLEPVPSFASAMVIADSSMTSHGLVNTCAGKLQIRWAADPQDADGQIDGGRRLGLDRRGVRLGHRSLPDRHTDRDEPHEDLRRPGSRIDARRPRRRALGPPALDEDRAARLRHVEAPRVLANHGDRPDAASWTRNA